MTTPKQTSNTKNNPPIQHRDAASKPVDDYWFYIETYVHIALKKESLLLYNTFNGKILEYNPNDSANDSAKIFALVRRLMSAKNLWIIRLKARELQDPVIGGFVRAVRGALMGDLLNTAWSENKPIQTVPMVTIEKDVRHLKEKNRRSVGEGLMEYLAELSIHINSRCDRDCACCESAFRQFHCCTRSRGGSGELALSAIETLLIETLTASISSINILGGDITAYSRFEELVKQLETHGAEKCYVVHYKNVAEGAEQLGIINPADSRLKIPVTFPLDRKALETANQVLTKIKMDASFSFMIESEADYEAAETISAALELEDYAYAPFYNGGNLEFFRQNVFSDKEEILAAEPSLREIYQNGEVNSLNFGRLSVYANGDMHANANGARLGILGDTFIYEALYKELYEGKSWRRIRKNLSPCKSCTFHALCPPPSDYTHAIGRNDLCFKGISSEA